MTHFWSRRRAQARAIEALLAVFIMTAAIFTATFYSTTTSQVVGEDLQQTANNLLYTIDSKEALKDILSAGGDWESQLQLLIQSLLPAGMYYNATIILSNGTVLNTSPIGNMQGRTLSQFGETITVTYVISISLPNPYTKSPTGPSKFDFVLINDISGSMKWVEPSITNPPLLDATMLGDGSALCTLDSIVRRRMLDLQLPHLLTPATLVPVVITSE